jgi:hypothetical protein
MGLEPAELDATFHYGKQSVSLFTRTVDKTPSPNVNQRGAFCNLSKDCFAKVGSKFKSTDNRGPVSRGQILRAAKGLWFLVDFTHGDLSWG